MRESPDAVPGSDDRRVNLAGFDDAIVNELTQFRAGACELLN